MAEAPIRFGIIGCADIARKLCRAIALAPNATLHAVASRSLHKARHFAAENRLFESFAAVEIYGSYEQLLDDPAVEAVYVPLPTSLHASWAVAAARKKKHVLLEKPTALDVGELDRILEACRANGVQFMDGTMWYHHPRTARMKELLSNPQLFGQLRFVQSISTFTASAEFLNNDIRVKPDLDALGALGDTGWYCIGAILWAANYKLPAAVTAFPRPTYNQSGVILSCGAAFHWDDSTTATFHCSFLANQSMELAVLGSNGTLHLKDFILPLEESSASFEFSSGAAFAELHIGWNREPEKIWVASELPQEVKMIHEFAGLVQQIKMSGNAPDGKWPEISRNTQLVMDALKKSIDLGSKTVHL